MISKLRTPCNQFTLLVAANGFSDYLIGASMSKPLLMVKTSSVSIIIWYIVCLSSAFCRPKQIKEAETMYIATKA